MFVGGLGGSLRAFDAGTGTMIWSTHVGGRILGAPLVVGNHVFFSTKEGKTYGLRTDDGKVVWMLPLGRYSPGIATRRTYFFSVNGRLLAFHGRRTTVADLSPSR